MSINRIIWYKCDNDRYAEVEPLYKRSLAIKEKILGPEHPDVALSLYNLAYLYHNQARYVEVETERLYKRSLAIVEKAFGTEHPDVAVLSSTNSTLKK